MNASERSIMIKHIMDPATPNNLAIALDTADVISEVQRRILVAGVKDLVEKLTTSNRENPLRCIDDSLATDPMARFAHLMFRKEHWPSGYAVGVEADAANASQIFIGVVTGSGHIDEQLRSMLAAYRVGGAGNEHWPWWYWVSLPYDRWTNKDALRGFRSGKAVPELASQLAEVVGIVDRFCAG